MDAPTPVPASPSAWAPVLARLQRSARAAAVVTVVGILVSFFAWWSLAVPARDVIAPPAALFAVAVSSTAVTVAAGLGGFLLLTLVHAGAAYGLTPPEPQNWYD